jgi:hypothetical protein
MSRSRVAAAGAAVAVGGAGLVLLAFAVSGQRGGRLKLDGDGYDYCYHPPASAAWLAQSHNALIFGLDALELSSVSAEVTVISVKMIDPTGGIVLRAVAFVPNAEVGIGTPGDQPIYTTTRSLAAEARTVPATLARTDQTNPKIWQLAVTVSAPVSAVQARAAGFLLTYKSGSSIRTIKTRDTVTLGTASC